MEMGFTKDAVMEAYRTTGKDMEAAAVLLVDNAPEKTSCRK